jgi:hypothetical protein
MVLDALRNQVASLADAVNKGDTAAGQKQLQLLKIELLSMDSLPPTNLSKAINYRVFS